MFEPPQIMRQAQMMARHAGASQTQVARNLANSDTPGYRGYQIETFEAHLDRTRGSGLALKGTRAGHIQNAARSDFRLLASDDPVDRNGNDVSIETEMLRAASAQSQHATAVTIYKSSLDLLRSALGRGR